MNIELNLNSKSANVKLSRSNLKALLHKLDVENSARTIVRVTEDDWYLMVTAEEDEDHYGTRKRGLMTDETEKAIAE